MSTVSDGAVKVYKTNGGVAEEIIVQGGFAEVTPKGITVLAEHVEG
jgi:F-type H+-transporting ATPase subunit epsilon